MNTSKIDQDPESAQPKAEVDLQETASPAGTEAADKKDLLDDAKQIESFGSKIEYWLCLIGYAVGFGNIWRFPYLVFTNGGAAFLIPYLLAMVLVAIPMYLLETTFGQLVRCKLHNRYAMINQKVWGFGLL